MDADVFELEILRQLKETAPSTTSTEIENTDEDFAFGKTIALTLKRLQPQQKSLAKMKIQQLLYEIEFHPPLSSYHSQYGYNYGGTIMNNLLVKIAMIRFNEMHFNKNLFKDYHND